MLTPSVCIQNGTLNCYLVELNNQVIILDPHPCKPRITFREDGTFKLLVLSDLHFGENPWDDWGPRQDEDSLKLLRKVLVDEHPDYV